MTDPNIRKMFFICFGPSRGIFPWRVKLQKRNCHFTVSVVRSYSMFQRTVSVFHFLIYEYRQNAIFLLKTAYLENHHYRNKNIMPHVKMQFHLFFYDLTPSVATINTTSQRPLSVCAKRFWYCLFDLSLPQHFTAYFICLLNRTFFETSEIF